MYVFCSSVRPLLLLTFLCGMGRTMHFVKETFLCEFLSESINLMPYYRWQLLLSFQNSVKEYNPNFLLIIAFLWIWHHVQPVCPTFISSVIPYIMKPESAMVWEIIEYPICIRSVAFRKERKKFFFWCATIVHTLFVGLSLYIRTHTRTHIQVGMLFLVCTLLCYFYILVWVMKSNNYEGKCFWKCTNMDSTYFVIRHPEPSTTTFAMRLCHVNTLFFLTFILSS